MSRQGLKEHSHGGRDKVDGSREEQNLQCLYGGHQLVQGSAAVTDVDGQQGANVSSKVLRTPSDQALHHDPGNDWLGLPEHHHTTKQ